MQKIKGTDFYLVEHYDILINGVKATDKDIAEMLIDCGQNVLKATATTKRYLRLYPNNIMVLRTVLDCVTEG